MISWNMILIELLKRAAYLKSSNIYEYQVISVESCCWSLYRDDQRTTLREKSSQRTHVPRIPAHASAHRKDALKLTRSICLRWPSHPDNTPQHFPSCGLLFWHFSGSSCLLPPLLHPLRLPFSPSLSLARGKSQSRKSFLAFFRDAINDARFPFGWASGRKRRGLDCRAYFFAVSFSW